MIFAFPIYQCMEYCILLISKSNRGYATHSHNANHNIRSTQHHATHDLPLLPRKAQKEQVLDATQRLSYNNELSCDDPNSHIPRRAVPNCSVAESVSFFILKRSALDKAPEFAIYQNLGY